MRRWLGGLSSLAMAVGLVVVVAPAPQAAANSTCWLTPNGAVRMCGTLTVDKQERGGAMHFRTSKITWKANPVAGAGRGYRVVSVKVVHSARSLCRTSTWSKCSKFDVTKSWTFNGSGPHELLPSYRNKWGELSPGPNWTGTTAKVTYQYGTGKKRTMTKVINEGSVSWW